MKLKTLAAAIATTTLLAASSFCTVQAYATEIDDVRAELEAAQERYNGTQDEQTRIQEQIDTAEQKKAETQSQLDKLRDELRAQARWEYKNNPIEYFVGVMTGSADLGKIVNEISYLQTMSEQRSALMNEAEKTKSALNTVEAELSGAHAQSAIVNEQAKQVVDSISSTLEEYEEEQRAIYGYQGGGPVSAVPASGSVVDYARSRIGCPYVWGAAGPEAFDCSGLTMWAYAQVGVSIPHQSEAQYAAADEVVPLSEARPGDILWRSGHVGLCTSYGATSYVHAPNFGCFVREGDPIGWSGFSCALRFYGVS